MVRYTCTVSHKRRPAAPYVYFYSTLANKYVLLFTECYFQFNFEQCLTVLFHSLPIASMLQPEVRSTSNHRIYEMPFFHDSNAGQLSPN